MNNTFTKDQLKTGMVMVFKDGSSGMVLLDTAIGDICAGSGWFQLKHLNDDELFGNENASDIHKVSEVKLPKSAFDYTKATRGLYFSSKTIWKRQEKSPQQIRLEELVVKQREIADEIANEMAKLKEYLK